MAASKRITFQITVASGDQKFVVNTNRTDATSVRMSATVFGLDGTGSTLQFGASQFNQVEGASNVVVPVGGALVLTPSAPQVTIAEAPLTGDHLVLDFLDGDATTGTITVVVTFIG